MKYNGSDKWKQEATKKLNRIPENIIKDVKVNNESVVDEEGIANVAVPVYVSDLDDADQYVLNEQLEDFYKKNETYSREEVNNLVDTIPKFAIEVVTILPTTQISTTTIYLIKTSETETGNLYTEYIYVNGNWEILGIQKLDLTNYYTKQEVDGLISGLRTETQEAVSNLNENIISHIGDSIKHITNTERTNWDLAKTHADSDHARTDATKVEKSTTNGNIKINGSETNVYTHPSGTNPHGTTKSDIGLGNVGNFKAVSTVASQGLTDTEKSNARANIGAGTSSFSGSYNDLSNKPTIPTVGNGTVTIKQAGTSKGTFTMNQSGDTVIELTDSNTTYGVATSSTLGLVKSGTDITVDANGNVSVNDDSHNHSNYLTSITKDMVTSALGYTPPTTDTNTWRGIQNNLTSDSTTDSLSAAQGKVLKTLIDDIEVGGRNLILNTGLTNGTNNLGWWQPIFTEYKDEIITDSATKSGKARKITYVTSGSHGALWLVPNLVGKTLNVGDTYSQSCMMKVYSNFRVNWGHEGLNKSTDNVTTEWQEFEFTTTVTSAGTMERAVSFYPDASVPAGFVLYIADYKLEKGNTPTDWSPAPEDYLPTSGGVLTGEIIAPSFKTTNSKVNIWDDNEGGNIRCDGEITSTYPNAFRAVYNNCGFFIRNDGVDTYFMFTNYGDPYGSWNSLRPMRINIASGNVMFGDRTVILHSNGQIYRNGLGSAWIHGRDYALTRADSIDGYSAFASIKTTNGSWEIGAYSDPPYCDNLMFTYITDSDYNASINRPTSLIRFCTDGAIEGNITGNAGTATKLTTVRNIALSGYSNGSANFDGSGNISINDTGYSTTRCVTGDETSKPYWRIASITHNYDFQDSTMICIIDSGYSSGGSGIFKVQLRSDIISGAVAGRTYGDIEWLVRNGFSADQLILKINSPASNDNNYADLYFKATGTYNACTIKVISAGARGHIDPRIWLLYDGSEPTRADMDARTYTNQITGHDSGTVHSSQYANTSGTSTYAKNVWTQSHNGDWYINSNWNGSYFVTNAKSTSGDILPIYVDNPGRADTLSGFTNTTTSATAVDNATQNGHIYVNDALGIVSQSDYVNDGACYVQAYSSTWVHQIYGDYRTGQIAVRGKNNGTWQSWRKVLDSLNYKSYCTPANIGAMGSVTANGYEGMAKRDGSTSDWIRTTYNGIIPYQEGVAGSGHSSLGTPSWYFSKAYIDNIYGYLNGNISGNAATATKLATARYIFGKSFNGTEDITGQAEVYGYYNSTVQSRFSSSGLKIRENGLVGSSQSDIGYAPSIGFFWNERIGSTLCLDKDGIFRFLKQEGTRATIDADVNGNINGYTWSPETPILHPSSSNTPFKILALDNTTVKYHTIPEYIVGSYNDSIFYKITNVLTFKDSNNALITGDKGNFIWAVSSWSDRKLKKNIKDANVSALDKINQIQFKEFDFIDDKKFGKHQELGYIADELKEVFPECVVTVPQDKEKFGYEELDQVQDVGLIKYLAKSIQELSSIINEQNKKINTLQKEVDKLKRKN